MKKARRRFYHFKISLCAFCLFTLACGIDYYIYLEPVNDVTFCNSFDLSSIDPTNNRFSFYTRDSANSSSTFFKGFQIYYRIYNSKVQMSSDRSYINGYNSNTDTQANIISYLENKKFMPLVVKGKSVSPPVIPKSPSGYDRAIKIHLGNPQSSGGDSLLIDDVLYGVPIRAVSTTYKTKTFFDTDEFLQEDEDIFFTESEAPGGIGNVNTWYVFAYVLTYGVDEMYSPVFSVASELGGLVIEVNRP